MIFLFFLAPKFFYPFVFIFLLFLGALWGMLFSDWYFHRFTFTVRRFTSSEVWLSLSSISAFFAFYLIFFFLFILFGIFLKINIFEDIIYSNWIRYVYLFLFVCGIFYYIRQYQKNFRISLLEKYKIFQYRNDFWFLCLCTLSILIPCFCLLSLSLLLLKSTIFYFTLIFCISLWLMGVYLGVVLPKLYSLDLLSFKKRLIFINIIIWGIIITFLFQKVFLDSNDLLIYSIASIIILLITYFVLNKYFETKYKFLFLHILMLLFSIISCTSYIVFMYHKQVASTPKNKDLFFTRDSSSNLQISHQRKLLITVKNEEQLENVIQKSQERHKSMFLYFSAKWCAPCRNVYKELLPDKKLLSFLKEKDWLFVEIDITEIGIFNDKMSKKFNVDFMPTFILIDKNKKEIFRIEGYQNKKDFLKKLRMNSLSMELKK